MKNMLFLILIFFVLSTSLFSQNVGNILSLNQKGALELADSANKIARKLGTNISIVVLDASGVTLLVLKGDNVGPHNTEASRRKAYTSLSTKTSSYELMQKSAESIDAKNLNTFQELLLLGGGTPIWYNDKLIGSIGVSGGGGGLNDDQIAKSAVELSGFSISPTK